MIKVKYIADEVFVLFIKTMSNKTQIKKISRVKNSEGQTQIHVFCVTPTVEKQITFAQSVWIFANGNEEKQYKCSKINGKERMNLSKQFNQFVEAKCVKKEKTK